MSAYRNGISGAGGVNYGIPTAGETRFIAYRTDLFEKLQKLPVRYFDQRQATLDVLSGIDGLSFVKNQAAFYLFPRLDVKKFGITNDKQFARDLLRATNILVVPGSGFDWAEPDHFRIVMLPQADQLRQAMIRLGNFLDGYHQG